MLSALLQRAGKPYIGVTGYTAAIQANTVSEAVKGRLGDRILMDGYLLRPMDCSDRWRKPDDRFVKYAARFIPPEEAVTDFGSRSTDSLKFVHFCTNIQRQLDEQLRDCVDRFGHGIDGFQINWIKPHPLELQAFKQAIDRDRDNLGLPPIALILQLHPEVLAEAGADTSHLLRFVQTYASMGAITHVLYDPSAGRGKGFDPQLTVEVSDQLSRQFPDLMIGVAGGLSPENVREKVEPVWRKNVNICIDVEGRVRDHNDTLDLDRTIAYVKSALELRDQIASQEMSE